MRFTPASCLALLVAAAAGGLCDVDVDIAAAIERVQPETKQCAAGGGKAGGGDECRTAAQAAPLMAASFAAYNVSCVQEAACLVGLMLVESAGLKFKHNVSPGVLGQGTANMQSPNFNLRYAKDVAPGLADDLRKATDGAALTDAQKKAMMAVVTDDKFNFASAAWFHNTQCADEAVKAKLRDGGIDGCGAYLATCVGVPKDDATRVGINKKIYKEMGVESAKQCVALSTAC